MLFRPLTDAIPPDAPADADAPPETSRTEPPPPHVAPGAGDASAEPAPAGLTITLGGDALAAGNSCVQCGLCLPACPTYLETGNEADSPRGRIRLMLGLHDGSVPRTDAGQAHLDRCLDCRACETACPSGVQYHALIEDAREKLEARQEATAGKLPTQTRFQRWLFREVLTRPNRLRLALLPARVLQKARLWPLLDKMGAFRLLPGTLRRMTRMLPYDPSAPMWPKALPAHSRGGGMDLVVKMLNPLASNQPDKPKKLVGFFEGCVAQVLASKGSPPGGGADVRRRGRRDQPADAGLLRGHPPPQQRPRIGQIAGPSEHRHLPARPRRRRIGLRRHLHRRRRGNAAGSTPSCWQTTRGMRSGPKAFAARVRDVSEVLVELGLPDIRRPLAGTVTYHDACHLAHGQGVTSAPRQLLAKVPGLTVVDLPESDRLLRRGRHVQPDAAGDGRRAGESQARPRGRDGGAGAGQRQRRLHDALGGRRRRRGGKS